MSMIIDNISHIEMIEDNTLMITLNNNEKIFIMARPQNFGFKAVLQVMPVDDFLVK